MLMGWMAYAFTTPSGCACHPSAEGNWGYLLRGIWVFGVLH